MTDYETIPLRRTARIEEIESVKQLQDEDLRLAHYSNQAFFTTSAVVKNPHPKE